MKAGDLCDRDVAVTRSNMALADAIDLLTARHLDVMFVVAEPDGERIPIGILTGSEAAASLPRLTHTPGPTVADVMNTELLTVSEGEDVDEVRGRMESCGVDYVTVVDGRGELMGVLRRNDIVRAES